LPISSPPSANAAAESPRRVAVEVALAAFAVGALAVALGLPDRALLLAGAAMSLGAGILIVAAARAGIRAGGLGWPNRVTLVRALIAALLVGHLLVPERREVAALLALVAVLSDAIDGWLARRLSAGSDFGARFDMETDAALLLVLCLLLFAQGIAGPWVLALGAARYVFIAGLALAPWLDRQLPPSDRRRNAAAATMVALVLALMPMVPAGIAQALAAAATILTLASFAIDAVWLARTRAPI
jgi:phosphatidylglycerophosphate synthase